MLAGRAGPHETLRPSPARFVLRYAVAMEADWLVEEATLVRFAVAIAIGAIVGIERGWSQRALDSGARTMGLRTFTLIGMAGGILGLVGDALLVGAGLLALAGLLVVSYLRADTRDLGLTTEVAALTTFLLAVFSGWGFPAYAAAGGALVAAMLEAKAPLHRFLKGLAERELEAAIKLLVLAVVVLPVLPDADLGPDGLVNPRQIGMIAVALATISFLGYWLVKLMGPRAGPLLFGLAGGLVSSTAVTLASARLSRGQPGLAPALAGAIAAANAVMVARVAVVAGLIAPALLTDLVTVLAPIGLLSVAWMLWRLVHRPASETAGGLADMIDAPVPIGESVLMALLVGLVSLAASVGRSLFAGAGLLVVAAVTGLADVDALTITMARLAQTAGDGAAGDGAAAAVDGIPIADIICLAVIANMVSKTAMVAALGDRRLAIGIAGLFGTSVLIAAGAILARGLIG